MTTPSPARVNLFNFKQAVRCDSVLIACLDAKAAEDSAAFQNTAFRAPLEPVRI